MTEDQQFDYRRTLGRIEEGVSQLKESAEKRDRNLEALTERVRENEHARRNGEQASTNRIELAGAANKRIETSMSGLTVEITGLSDRVGALEAPVKRAMEAKLVRRRLVTKIVSIAAVVSSAVWVLAEPVWRTVVDGLIKRWNG